MHTELKLRGWHFHKFDIKSHQMSVLRVIMEKIGHFPCYITSNRTSEWLPWPPIIRELYLNHSSPLKKTSNSHKTSNSRTGTAGMLILLCGCRPSWICPKWGFKVLRNLIPIIFCHSFVPIDMILTLIEFGDSNLAKPIPVTCQPPPVTAHIKGHVNGQRQSTWLFVIKQMATRSMYHKYW